MNSTFVSKPRIVVVGNGMVGHHFVEQLNTSIFDVTVVGAESSPAYDRVHLSERFAGRTASDLALTTVDQYTEAGITVKLGKPVISIDRSKKSVQIEGGESVPYDQLILATGSYPFVPPIEGNNLDGCLVYRTLEDLDAIEASAAVATRGVVVGGGLLGLECANALKNLGLKTSVVEFAPGLMGVQLDEDGSGLLRELIEELDVDVLTSRATTAITGGEQHKLQMQFKDHEPLETDLVVFSAGIRPHDSLASACGLDVGERGGIVVDSHCKTSDPSVYAIGECALYDGRIFGLVAPGYRMAEVAADNLQGGESQFLGADMSTRLKLLGTDVAAVGDGKCDSKDSLAYRYFDPVNRCYSRMNVSSDGTRVLGAILVGDAAQYDTLLQYYLNELPLPESPGSLLTPASDDVGLTGDLLPATATICSCHNVNKAAVTCAIQEGCQDLGSLKANTRASTGCGGCAGLLKSVFEAELTAQGIEVDQSLCEHFRFTREELFHLINVEQIQDFETLIDKHGTGRGCDICKPTVASILASLYNAHVLTEKRAGLQDTNDHFLANIQKNGTYSVVPRIAGGEITPEKLIVLGEVARDFDLYTKITGGQRIDLFGAEASELPLIWRRLVDAGFETGHAYGKSVRTVKSCVGSTWCRYGVQDSVSMALTIENRYKGLRSPHKLKFAVSGCTRECAEAQSKDVGVIATENGWNMYVAGNGGMRPRHAELFATDLDDETLIKYIDRFLMFYVRTADRLQRTSVWMESLEGGLDYVKRVVIDDHLGIASELESQMANVVGTYACEWKAAIEDPEALKRFRQFVNTDDSDPNIVFVRERGQRRPANEADETRILAKEVS